MKNIYILCTIFCLLFGSCYKDKGNYSYIDSPELNITVPSTVVNAAVNSSLEIIPEISGNIDADNLAFQWDLFKDTKFIKWFDGKEFKHTFKLDANIPSPGNYTIRMRAIDKGNGREFYSPLVTVNLTSPYAGLVVLHGNDAESDIGLIRANDFLVSAGDIPTTIESSLFSALNGRKLRGRGISVIQSYTHLLRDINRANVVAITENEGVWLKYADFSLGGDWNSLFNSGINSGKPEYYTTQDQAVYAVDNGKIFPRLNNTYSIFPIPSEAVSTYTAGSPFFETRGRAQGFFFDKSLRGFVITGNVNTFYIFSNATFNQITTSAPFNLANMEADLLHLDKGGLSNHFMAVMQKSDGSKYLAELNWAASTNSQVPFAKYDMESLPFINSAKLFAFGDNSATMCYYSTPSKVYRFTAANGQSLIGKSNELRTQSGVNISFEGEVTMLKVLKPLINSSGNFKVNYYNRNKILLVGTWSNGSGTLHSLLVNETTGDVISQNSFTGFNRIYDAALKPL